jgi:hypothetical protein
MEFRGFFVGVFSPPRFRRLNEPLDGVKEIAAEGAGN